jgi:Cu/Ag efflux pump CusA
MAVVILGGIVTSTILNMVVIPALYLRYGAARPAVSRAASLDRSRGPAPAAE